MNLRSANGRLVSQKCHFLLCCLALSVTLLANASDLLSSREAAEKIFTQYSQARFGYLGKSLPQLVEAGERNLVRGNQELSIDERGHYLSSTFHVPACHPLMTGLAARINHGAKSDVEQLLLLHNFVLWRMTHASVFFGNKATPEALSTRKGKLALCMQENENKGVADAWLKPPASCGLLQEFNPGDNLTLAILFTGLHNCWGYAHLFAALARASGFPTQVVRQKENSGHIWNRVFVQGAWRVVDTTYDDTVYDTGTYEDNSGMKLDLEYFLISDQEAARQDPAGHLGFVILPN